jgi:hypothetical protein
MYTVTTMHTKHFTEDENLCRHYSVSGTTKELTFIMSVSPNPATQTAEVYKLFKTDKS